MKRILLLVIFLIPFSHFSDIFADELLSKNEACALGDGFYEKGLSVKYPGTNAYTREFIKKGNTLSYVVNVNLEKGKPVDYDYFTVMLFQYNCKTKSAKQIGKNLNEGVYATAKLLGAGSKYILSGFGVADGCGLASWGTRLNITQTFTGIHSTQNLFMWKGVQKIITGYDNNNDYYSFDNFQSTNNANIFTANFLYTEDQNCGQKSDVQKIWKVKVDLKNKSVYLNQ